MRLWKWRGTATCSTIRRRLDEWMNQRSVSSLPDDVADHLKVCTACRVYVSQWSAIELQLRALRQQWPGEDLPDAIQLVRSAVAASSPSRNQSRYLALAASALALLLAAFLLLRVFGGVKNPSILARRAAEGPPVAVPGHGAVSPDLPVAATR